MKTKYLVLTMSEILLVNHIMVKLNPGGCIGMCPVYSSKTKAKKDFPTANIIEIIEVD